MSFLTLLNGNPRRGWTTLAPWEGEVDRFFDEAFGRYERSPSAFAPAADFEETEGSYKLHLDIPGMKKEDIQIEVVGNQLQVRGERKQEKSGKFVSERTFGTFERTLQLPEDADNRKVEAAYADGVLTVTLAKNEAAKPRLIQVKG